MFSGVVIDSGTFARGAEELRGTVPVARLSRLQDMLSDRSGDIAYVLNGSTSPENKAFLRLLVEGEIALLCHRCLGPLRLQIESDKIFELVPRGQDLGNPAEESGDVERIHMDPKLDVHALVEDEVILGIPMVASHAEGSCAVPAVGGNVEAKRFPFGALNNLKRQ